LQQGFPRRGRVDNQGKYKTRGFLGNYKITVQAGTSSETFDVFVDSKGIDLNLKMKEKVERVCS